MGDRTRTIKIKPLTANSQLTTYDLGTANCELLTFDFQLTPNLIIKDSYKAKIKLWLDNPVVMPWTPPKNIPFFGAKRFSSYVEFNEWKRDLIKQIAREDKS